MANPPRIGVVTVTYNSGKVLDGFLRSTFAQDHDDFLLYVIDNASTDDTLAQLDACADPRLRVTANPDNWGVAAGNNQGIAAARADGCGYVLLVNNDTEFAPKLFSRLVAAAVNRSASLVAPKIHYFDPPDKLWYAGGDLVASRGYASIHYGQGETDRGQFDTPREVGYAPTCCLLAETSVFDRVGVMDERYFCYWDDTDFCFRARKAGYTIRYEPTATMRHKESSLTQGAASPFATYYGSRNRAYYIRKNVGAFEQPYAIAYCYARFLMRYLTKLDTRDVFRARLKAFGEGLRMQLRP
jgi:GT2 family glycosyltransferase